MIFFWIRMVLVMSFIPFGTAWVGTYPTSWAPECLYFADMSLACITFHVMYYLIACENGRKHEFRLNVWNIVSLVVYAGAAIFCRFSPIAAYVVVAVVTCWWMVPEKK